MPELIIQSRITPPKVPSNVVLRSRLTDLMVQNKEKKIILIQSPAGYGKTTLALDFLQSAGAAFAWFHVTEDVNNFYSFISYIVHSLKKLNDSFATSSLEVIESLKQSLNPSKDLDTIITTTVSTFINDCSICFSNDTFLVLDDLHNAGGDSWLKKTFEKLTEDLPQNLHIIITTRSRPDFNLSKLASKRELFRLHQKEVNFSIEEITQLLTNVYSVKYSDRTIDLFVNKMGGWITGIHLVLQAFGDDLSKAELKTDKVTESIFDFFANDIFVKLDEDTKKFLLSTALLENFTAEICNYLLGIRSSEEIIEELIRKNIFIELTGVPSGGSEEKSYNYHALFKDFLLSKNKESGSEEKNRLLLRKIYNYYKNAGNLIPAVTYAMMCGDYEEAIPMIIESSAEAFDSARFEVLWQWYSSLPENYFASDPHLLFYRGKLLKQFKADINKAYYCFTACQKLIGEKENEDLLAECIIETADTLMLSGKVDEALNCLNKIINSADKPENRAKILFKLGTVNYRLGPAKYDDVISLSVECLKICEEHRLKTIQTDVYNLLGTVYQDRGEFGKALFYYELVVKNVSNILRKYTTITNIILLNASSGNFVKAKDFLDEAKKIYLLYPSILFERNYLRTAALFRFETGDYEECIKTYDNLIAIELKSDTKQFIFWYYLIICEAYLFLNKAEKASEYCELALKFMDSDDEYEKIELELHNVLLEKKKGTPDKLEKIFLHVLEYYELNRYVYSKVQTMFHISGFYFNRGSFETALSYLSTCLDTCADKQYISFLEQNYLEHRTLFDFALAHKIQPEFIAGIHQSLLERNNYDWLSPECKKRLALETDNLYDIKLNCFGGIELFVRGKPVEESVWIRKKSKLMLVYLLLNSGTRFTKDKMMDLFFQELSADSAENIFHQSITNIRNALKPFQKSEAKKTSGGGEKKTSGEPSYVIYEDKILRLNQGVYYKIDAADFDRYYNKVKSAESDEAIKEKSARLAVDLYKGEFLAGYYEPWVEEMREEYSNKYTDLCVELVKLYKQKQLHYELTVYAEKLIDADNLNEDAYVDLIETFAKMGNINQAKSKFSSMLRIFNQETGEKPSKSALEKIQKILLL